VEIVHAPQRIEMDESPVQAIRRKPNSSIVMGLTLHKQGEVDAFVSAGSTGAILAGSLVILRPLEGVDRPPVGAVLPTSKGQTLMLDAGANIETRPQQLLQFAHLGSIYVQTLLGIERPRVGLLNIGEEPGKGGEQVQQTYQLLAASDLNFVGNIEGRDIIGHQCDVLVCDGFVGNVLLKFYESSAAFILHLLQEEVREAQVDLDLSRIFKILDYTEYGGAPLLGINGVVIICHGGSPPKAVTNAIRIAAQGVEQEMTSRIRTRIQQLHASRSGR
jgi:glycerol-3-phosphate acyltransferase PlsX